MRIVALAVCMMLLAVAPSSAQRGKSVSGKSETCREAVGQTQKDLSNALRFCKSSVPKDLDVQGVMAMDSLLWVKVNRVLANAFQADKLSGERIIKRWMAEWRKVSGSQSVTVYVEWQDVEIAKGETTLLSGDRVTIK